MRGCAALAAAAELGGGGRGAAAASVGAWLARLAAVDDAVAGRARGQAPPPRPGLVSRAAVAEVVSLLTPSSCADAEEDEVEDEGREGDQGEPAGTAAAAAARSEPPGFASLFDALQAAAEAAGGLDPLDPALDDWLPAGALARLGEGAASGAGSLLGRVVGGSGQLAVASGQWAVGSGQRRRRRAGGGQCAWRRSWPPARRGTAPGAGAGH